MLKRIHKLQKSFHYAAKGIHHTYRTQQNIWIHSAIAVVVLLLGIFLRFSLISLALLVLTCMVVLVAEMVNTVAETIIDLASPEYSDLGKRAKDIAAGSVLVAAFGAIIIGILLFYPALGKVLNL